MTVRLHPAPPNGNQSLELRHTFPLNSRPSPGARRGTGLPAPPKVLRRRERLALGAATPPLIDAKMVSHFGTALGRIAKSDLQNSMRLGKRNVINPHFGGGLRNKAELDDICRPAVERWTRYFAPVVTTNRDVAAI